MNISSMSEVYLLYISGKSLLDLKHISGIYKVNLRYIRHSSAFLKIIYTYIWQISVTSQAPLMHSSEISPGILKTVQIPL